MGGCDNRPVVAAILLSPLNSTTMDFSLFQLTVKELVSAPQDNKWSLRTGVRGVLRKAPLHPDRYVTREKKQRLASKLGDKWLDRPICSTVPARAWQKYLLKRSHQERRQLPTRNSTGAPVGRGIRRGSHLLYCGRNCVDPARARDAKLQSGACGAGLSQCICAGSIDPYGPIGRCGPDDGRQCKECFGSQWALPSDDPNPEVAWVEDVLRLMPVKDDRVTPTELCAELVATELWTAVDFLSGPPAHRLDDGSAPRFGSLQRTRQPLPSGARNGEAAPVHLGKDCFTVYCGMKFANPQRIKVRSSASNEKFREWDGSCGPGTGPQCPACRQMGDRLLS